MRAIPKFVAVAVCVAVTGCALSWPSERGLECATVVRGSG